MMRTTSAGIAAVVAVAVAGPALAVAALTEVGSLQGEATMPEPACPSTPCRVHSRTTGYQVKIGDNRATHVVKEDGRIVAWTIKLSRPGKKQIEFFEKNLGGESKAQITVLRPGNKLYARVLAQGEPEALEPYFGTTPQFALDESIPVKKGNIIGLTVPTWAPALAINQAGTVSWRATRPKGACDDFVSPTAQTRTNNITRLFCLYRTARLTYTATIVTDPRSPSNGTTGTTGRAGS